MKTIVAAFSSDLPSDLQQGILSRKDLRLVSAQTLPELLLQVSRGADLCLVGPQLSGENAASISQALKMARRNLNAAMPLVLLLTGGQNLPPGAASLFDEVFEWPQHAQALFTTLSTHFGWAMRTQERYLLRVQVFLHGGADNYLGASHDLSLSGMLLRTSRLLHCGERLSIRFTLPGRLGELFAAVRVVRIDQERFAPDQLFGLQFESLAEDHRDILHEYFTTLSGGRSFRWKLARSGTRQLIYLSGLLNADVDLTPLQDLRGELDFHMHDFRRISSDSIQTWMDLMRGLTGASKIRLHECPIQFIQQANAISNLLDNTEVVSFFGPYLCSRCGLDEERLITVKKDLYDEAGVLHRQPPVFTCVSCNGPMTFDDIPERFFMFL